MTKKKNLTAGDIAPTIISGGNLDILQYGIIAQSELKKTADWIKKTASFGAVFRLVDGLPHRSWEYDWNACSILQHFDLNLIVETLRQFSNRRPLYESVGLASIFGEYRRRDSFVIDYLYAVVAEAKDAKAWWRAAFSLELIGVEDAVSLLKRSLKRTDCKDLSWHLDHLADKRSLISVLTLSDEGNLEKEIYPRVREVFLKSHDVPTIIGTAWLLGRLRLIDDVILKRFAEMVGHKNYELEFYAYFALQECGDERLRSLLEKALGSGDPLIRRMATRGLISVGHQESLPAVEDALDRERDPAAATELCRAAYCLRCPSERDRLLVELRLQRNENGLFSGKRRVTNSFLVQAFADATDPDDLGFRILQRKLGRKKIVNPISLTCGTGRALFQILEHLAYSGTAIGLESSWAMAEFARRRLREERRYTRPVEIVQAPITQIPPKFRSSSSLVVRSFLFSDHLSDRVRCLEELKATHNLLAEDGIFVTIGWDNSFGDELSRVWYEHVSDELPVRDFDEWRQMKVDTIDSPQNCGLTWLKTGLSVPVRFSSLREAADVMGHIFGRDAAKRLIETGRTEWQVSLGITYNTKKELGRIIGAYKK